MADTIIDGPLSVYGNLGNIPAGLVYPGAVPDLNPDAGPSKFYQGTSVLDVRMLYLKDRVIGWTGVEQAVMNGPLFRSINQIPAAYGAAQIAAAQNPANGTPLTLASASVGVTLNVPIYPMLTVPSVLNGQPLVTAPIALDFGFGFGNCTSGNPVITVSGVTIYKVGMPLVIGGVGNSAGTIPLLTVVTAVTAGVSPTITVANAPLATNATAPIGTGTPWGPNEIPQGFQTPTAAYPFVAKGPGLFLDSRQTVSRGLSVTGVASGSGGTVLLSGWDTYGQPLTDLLTLAAGANTVYSTKTFKYFNSAVPNFTDTHAISVGTSDVFGFALATGLWETTRVCWNGALMTSSTGYTAADMTNPATNATGDVRGTIQTSAIGPLGSGIGSTSSNGTVVNLVMSGHRLLMDDMPSAWAVVSSTQDNPINLYGVQQA